MVRDRAGVRRLRSSPGPCCIVNERPRTTELQRAAAGAAESRAWAGERAGTQLGQEGLHPAPRVRGLVEMRKGERRREFCWGKGGAGGVCVLSV